MKKLSPKRRILIVGEGRETEYNYFVGFRAAFEGELEITATSIAVRRGRGGNARGIVETAIKEAKSFRPERRRGDAVYLLLDTEGEGRAPELPGAERLAKENNIEIVYSSPAFEYWLLCHFTAAPRGHFEDCDAVVGELNIPKRWGSVCKSDYHKADDKIFNRLCQVIEAARQQALEIDLINLTTKGGTRKVNPSSQVYELIARLIGVRTGERCPIEGTWRLVDNTAVSCQSEKGQAMPGHAGNAVVWAKSTP